MRKWLCVGMLAAVVSITGGYWFFFKNPSATDQRQGILDLVDRLTRQKGIDVDAEASETIEVIEPLVVDRGSAAPPARLSSDDGPMPRATWTGGMKQPPRPDVESGRVLRMPYADEAEFLAIPFDPIQRILESKLNWLEIFDALKETDPSEEPEAKDIPRPNWNPHAYPHCPYTGGCPAPYPYRMSPRN